jgi:ATP/maltotriose-dependent transcriptional regulator MalT
MQLLPPGTRTWFGAAGGLATSTSLQDDSERLLALVEVVSRTAPRDPSTKASQVVVLATIARCLFRAGLRVAAESLLEQLEGAMQAMAHEPAVLADLHTAFAIRALVAGDMMAGRTLYQMSVACFEQAGDVRNATLRRMTAAAVLLELGDPAGSAAELQEVLGPALRTVGPRLAFVIRYRLARALACQGALSEARALAEQAVMDCAPEDRWYGSHARSCLSLILIQVGDLRAAEVTAQEAVEASAVTPRRCFALAVLGRARLLQGRAAEARAAAEEALRLLEQGGVEEGEALVRLVLAEAIHATGDIAAARAALAAAKRRLLDRAAMIQNAADAGVRRRFLENVPEHARTLELAQQWEDSAGSALSGSRGPGSRSG